MAYICLNPVQKGFGETQKKIMKKTFCEIELFHK
jgi:hypothetical protein